MKARGIAVRETVDARKVKYGPAALKHAFAGAERLLVAKGKRVAEFDLRASDVDWQAIADSTLGRSGSLRAPAVRIGRTMLVGFTETAWDSSTGG